MRAVSFLIAATLVASPLSAACPKPQVVDGVPVTTCKAADSRFETIRAELMKAVRQKEIPSAAVAVIAGDTTVWEESIGWADREKNVPASAETAYLLASMGKSITATGVMKLVER